jgi:hypothetical protein
MCVLLKTYCTEAKPKNKIKIQTPLSPMMQQRDHFDKREKKERTCPFRRGGVKKKAPFSFLFASFHGERFTTFVFPCLSFNNNNLSVDTFLLHLSITLPPFVSFTTQRYSQPWLQD